MVSLKAATKHIITIIRIITVMIPGTVWYSSTSSMTIWVVKISREGYKIIQIFGQKSTYSEENHYIVSRDISIRLGK